MRAVVVHASQTEGAKLLTLPDPQPDLDEVLVRVLDVGLDRTDLEIATAVYGEAPPSEEILIIGHEAVGQVEAVGAAVRHLAVGDYAVPTVRRPCPERCLPCCLGQVDFCLTGHYMERGIKGANGYLAELFFERPEHLLRVPLRYARLVVLLEPLSVVAKGIGQIFRAQQRLPWEPQRAVVLGAGSIGLLATFMLRLRGLEVFTASREQRDAPEVRLVEGMGARYLDTNASPVPTLARELGNLDIIFEATGSSTVAFQAMEALGANGVLCLTGVSTGDRKLEIPADRLNLEMELGNKLVFGTVSSNLVHLQAELDCLCTGEERWPGFLERMITRRLPLDRYGDRLGEEEGIKTVIEASGDDLCNQMRRRRRISSTVRTAAFPGPNGRLDQACGPARCVPCGLRSMRIRPS